MGLDTVLIATDSAATELEGTLFLIGRNLGLKLPHITRSHFYIGGGEGQVVRLSKQDKAQKQVWVRPGIEVTRPPLTFGIISGINFCPPKPGSMVITRTMSTRETKGITSSTGVPGLMPIPT